MSSVNVTTFTNATLLADPELCTLRTCPLTLANILYLPSIPGNAIYLAIFALLLPIQVFFSFRYRTYGFLVGTFCGLVLEILGYAGRIIMHHNPFQTSQFLMYIVCLTIGPAFLSAAIYLCLARIISVYGRQFSRFKPWVYTTVFMLSDLVALLLQASGGAITNSSDLKTVQAGINVMIAGLSAQVFSLTIFIILCADLAWRVFRGSSYDPAFEALRNSKKWTWFLIGKSPCHLGTDASGLHSEQHSPLRR